MDFDINVVGPYLVVPVFLLGVLLFKLAAKIDGIITHRRVMNRKIDHLQPRDPAFAAMKVRAYYTARHKIDLENKSQPDKQVYYPSSVYYSQSEEGGE